jgi:hypothetical protein
VTNLVAALSAAFDTHPLRRRHRVGAGRRARIHPAVRADIVFTLDTDGRAVVLTVRQYGTEIAAHRR